MHQECYANVSDSIDTILQPSCVHPIKLIFPISLTSSYSRLNLKFVQIGKTWIMNHLKFCFYYEANLKSIHLLEVKLANHPCTKFIYRLQNKSSLPKSNV